MTSAEIGSSVESIGAHAFEACVDLTDLVIPDGVKTIGASAFESCSSLTSLVIPDSVTTIGERAFAWCSDLTRVTLSDSVKTVNAYTFYGCYDLTSVEIGNSVTSIGADAFSYCNILTNVVYKGTANEWGKILINVGNDALIKATRYYNAVDCGIKGDVLWFVTSDGALIFDGEGDMPDFKRGKVPWYTYRSTITRLYATEHRHAFWKRARTASGGATRMVIWPPILPDSSNTSTASITS